MNLLKQPKVRSKPYRQWITQFPCIKCGKTNTQAAHLGRDKGWGTKACDSTCAPLCCVSPDGLGCHEKLDQYLEVRYWDENLDRAIAKMKMVYAFWKAKKFNDAEYLVRTF